MTKETTNVTVFGQETEFDGVLEFQNVKLTLCLPLLLLCQEKLLAI